MPTHIEHVVTEIVPESQPNQEGSRGDQRWQEKMKLLATIKQSERQQMRLRAEAFDD